MDQAEVTMRTWTHWTSSGTFELKEILIAKTINYELFFGGESLGYYCNYWTAAEDLAAGSHDAKIGVSASSIDIPSSIDGWNMLR